MAARQSPEILADGLRFPEGPRWRSGQGAAEAGDVADAGDDPHLRFEGLTLGRCEQLFRAAADEVAGTKR